MYKPVLSLDVSKENSFAATYLSHDEPLGKPISINHNRYGLSVLIEQLKTLERLTGRKPEVILESTGNYSKLITYNLQEAGYSVIVLNPLETHEQKRRSIRKIKTDKVDTHRIAKLYYMEKRKPLQPIDPDIAELKNLCRQYDGLSVLYIETQLRFRSILELLFPHYCHVFSDLCGDSSLRLIYAFPTPEAILSASKEDILQHLNSKCQKKGWADEIYQKLLAAATTSLPYKVAQLSNIRVLREYVPILMIHKSLLAGLRAQIVAAAKDIPAYSLITTIPGVGGITAASIIAEIGSVDLFPTAKQLVAFAGLDPSVFESGNYKATKNKISKRGSNYLRKALFQSTMAGISKRKKKPVNPMLYELYTNKVAQGKKKMVALIAVSNKLLRIIYGVWRNNEPFKLD